MVFDVLRINQFTEGTMETTEEKEDPFHCQPLAGSRAPWLNFDLQFHSIKKKCGLQSFGIFCIPLGTALLMREVPTVIYSCKVTGH